MEFSGDRAPELQFDSLYGVVPSRNARGALTRLFPSGTDGDMTSRDRVTKALAGESPDRIPFGDFCIDNRLPAEEFAARSAAPTLGFALP